MSSYFDKFDRGVSELSKITNDEEFLLGLKELEKTMIHTCELFAGDRDTPTDIQQAIIKCITLNQVRYKGGDFLGDEFGPCEATRMALASRQSRLSKEMHSLWHDIASRRLEMRYGLVLDNPKAAVEARDRHAEEKFGRFIEHPTH